MSPWKVIDEIEMDVVEQGLKLVKKYGFHNMVINVDFTATIHHLKREEPPWNIRGKFRKIKSTMEKLHSCAHEHCYRETNFLVDELAGGNTNGTQFDPLLIVVSSRAKYIVDYF